MPVKSHTNKWNPALIKLLRGKRTQDDFARLIGAPKNTVWRWEAGYASPAAAYIKKLTAVAEQEGFLSDWSPVGSITWVGDLEKGAKEIALEFSRTLGHSSRRPKPGAGAKPH
jgi:transcriptional regulator with XRE-family HTH domain